MLSVVSLFIGAGGLDLGFKDAGFELRIGVENDGIVDPKSEVYAVQDNPFELMGGVQIGYYKDHPKWKVPVDPEGERPANRSSNMTKWAFKKLRKSITEKTIDQVGDVNCHKNRGLKKRTYSGPLQKLLIGFLIGECE